MHALPKRQVVHYRKAELRKRIICETLVPGREDEIHIGLHIQTSSKRALFYG
jgi:hypothetical protein